MFRKILLLSLAVTILPILGYSQSYRYSDIPDSITGDVKRAAYMAEHYWDNADFGDTLLLKEPKRVLDFIFLLQVSREEASIHNIALKTVDRFSGLGRGVLLQDLLYWLNRYLHNSESPMYDDELYLEFIEILMQKNAFGPKTEELKEIHEILLRNRIGHNAEDFDYVCRDGLSYHLYGIEAEYLIVMFYNPECSRCKNNIREMCADSTVSKLMSSGILKILAICPWGDYDEWEKSECPDGWLCGFDKKAIIAAKRLYDIQQLPSLYLLDKNKRVLVKEAGGIKYLFR